MNIIGIIAEYNPLHLGHIYQIKKAKELYQNSTIILITNSTFTQRGDISIINKWDKTKLCLDNNIDLVVELPFVFATQSADIFAKGALKILNELKIDTLIFGSESDDTNKLKEIALTQLKNPTYSKKVKLYLDNGLNYPTAMSRALKDILGYTINKPNDILALSYIKEIIRNDYKINPVSIKRTNDYHDTHIKTNIVNASLIRKMIADNKNITNYIPNYNQNYLYKNITLENFYPFLKYKIITSNNLEIYQTVDEGIENRIKKMALKSNSWEEIVKNIKTKRYTYNKINRMLVHILTNFTKEEAQNINVDYIRILGFNSKGQQHLKTIKKNLYIPTITNYKPNLSQILDIELRVTQIYSSIIKKETLATSEFSHLPIIKKD